jgi:uncharacterized protein involved in outer membrane biogenesis
MRFQPLLRKYWRTALVAVLGLAALVAVVGFLLVPPLLKSVLVSQLGKALHREVSLREVAFNPFTLAVTLAGVSVKEPQGPETFASVDRVYFNLEGSSLFRWAAVIREIRLTKPYLRVVRRSDQTYNFGDLLPAADSPPSPPAKPLRFSINNIRIEDGSADFLDQVAERQHSIRELNVGIPFLSNISSYVQIFVEPELRVSVNGTRYALHGKTKPFTDSLETVLDLTVHDLDLPFYLAYVPPALLTFTMPSGRLDATLALSFVRSDKGGQSLSLKGSLGIRELAIDEKAGLPVVRIPDLKVDVASIGVFARLAYFSRIVVDKPELFLRREKSGGTNLEALLPKPAPAAQAAPAPAPAREEFVLDVDEFTVSGATVRIADLAPATPFRTTLAPLDLAVRRISTRRDINGTYTLALRTDAAESLALEGTFSLAPLTVDGQVEGKSIPLKRYAPYYADQILADIESGALNFAAKFAYAQSDLEPVVRAFDAGASLSGLRVVRRDSKAEVLRIPRLALEQATVDLTRREVTLGSISSTDGALAATRLENGTLDLQTLLPAPPPGPAQPAAPAERPWAIVLKRLALDQYTARLADRAAATPIVLTAEKIRLSGDNLSTAKAASGTVALDLRLDQSATVSAAAKVGLDPLRVEGRAEVRGIALNRYAAYYQPLVRFDVQDGMLDVATNYRLTQGKETLDVAASGLSTTLKSLRLATRDTHKEFVKVSLVTIRNGTADLAKQDVAIGEIATEGGTIDLVRGRDGTIDLVALLAPPTPADTPATPAIAAPATPSRPWTVQVAKVSVAGYQVRTRDEGPAEPVTTTLDDLALKAERLSTVPNSAPGSASLAFRVRQAAVALQGTVGITPIQADLQVKVSDLDLRPFEPYVADRVRVTLSDGRLGVDGRLALTVKEPIGLQATYTGSLLVSKLAVLEKASTEELLSWQSLAFQDVSASVNPVGFRAKKVALADFFARVALQADGTVNLQHILQPAAPAVPASEPAKPAEPAEPSPASAAEPAAAPIQIDELTLQAGRLAFSDESVKPHFSADLAAIGGRVTGLSSAEASLGDLELRGRYNNAATLEITGKINPLRKDLFADIRARFTGMDLSPTSPYSGKYVGYGIAKGKLSFDLKYLIDRRKLNSENKVFIDQLTFGDKVESPTATGLPVKLAVALLKDRNGEIHLDIPVTGSLDDPQFSIWGVVWQIVGNLIAKAVTSPFALMGSLFAGAEGGTQALEFEPGRAVIGDAGMKTLDALAKGLADKPALKLEIAGYVDPDADREGLKQYLLQRKVKAQKLGALTKKGEAAVPVDDVVVAPAEYEAYLTLAYRAEPFPKPRNFIGLVKKLPVAEMEKLILTHIQVGDDELRQLAARRAGAVRDALLQAGTVDAERLFILEPKALTPEPKGHLKNSRVEFKIA